MPLACRRRPAAAANNAAQPALARWLLLHCAGKDGASDIEFPLDKKSILIGRCASSRRRAAAVAIAGLSYHSATLHADRPCCREHSCDIRIVNKEISRKHAEVYVEDTGAVRVSWWRRAAVVWMYGAPRNWWSVLARIAGVSLAGSRLCRPLCCRCSFPAWGGSLLWSTAHPSPPP